MTFPEVKRFDHPALEREILRWWKEHDIFKKSIEKPAGAPTFSFYEGPPTANGQPGIHHVMARTIKDTFCRFKTMKGFRVERKAGWDTHGLPVEIEVEKELGLEGRHQVESYGIEKYNAACRESVLRYKAQWDELTTRMGYWVDLEHPYITFETKYIETVWWLIKQIHEKGLLYKGYKIQWYSPGSGTVLSSHEVSLGYREVQDPSVYVRFRATDAPETFFLAWTTTPWTLISNAALAVGPEIDYVKVRREDPHTGTEYLILARDRLEVLREDYEVVATFKGRELVGKTYEPLYPYFTREVPPGRAWRVVPADYVSTEDGTGIVHTAPAFGAEDFETAKREGLPLLNPIDAEGRFTDQARLVAGLWFKDADRVIIRDLRERGLLYRHETYLHNYPHDWRRGTPLMSYPVEGWFIRTTAVKDRLIALNETINWQPESIGRGRFGEWLRNNVDWALSRRRYWGTPLPVWESDAPGSGYVEVIGSIAELRRKCGDQLPERDDEIDLHRPFVDRLTWPAPDGGTMRRVPDLIDVWFDSGAMPFAQWHYPFENREAFRRSFPADFIAEGVDQTRGWFYTLHAIATIVMDSVAYKNCVVNGLVLDEKGEKMSKSRGNAVNPFEVIASHGADLVRWYMMSNTPPWEDLKFSEQGIRETLRKFFGTLGNVYNFFATYANIDGFRYAEPRVAVADRAELDRWIMSRLNTTVAEVDAALEAYHPTKAARAIERFVDELSNWYIRRSRRRFWAKAAARQDAEDKLAAYQTVYECLIAVAKLMSPIAPFFGEWIYRALNETTGREAAVSVHLADFPAVEPEAVDAALEHRMGLARTISSVVLALRNTAGINVRQPLPRILVVTGVGVEREAVEQVEAIIRDEVNVKAVEYVAGTSGVVRRSAKPNFKVLGRRLGKLMKPVNEAVRALSDDAIERYLTDGRLTLHVDGQEVALGPGDLEVVSEGIEGWLVGQEGGVTVALDTTITDELRAEGLARETVNRIQNLRKQANFEVTDRIAVRFRATPRLREAVRRHAEWIRNETLALELEEATHPEGDLVERFEIDAEEVTVGVRRIET
ncbi:MAG: isoleucine--tRNA ligase [Rhodothermaceae bacterium]|nr:MAG: isoleucine--tRNA ligase [Rhodothermaceae bacterium]